MYIRVGACGSCRLPPFSFEEDAIRSRADLSAVSRKQTPLLPCHRPRLTPIVHTQSNAASVHSFYAPDTRLRSRLDCHFAENVEYPLAVVLSQRMHIIKSENRIFHAPDKMLSFAKHITSPMWPTQLSHALLRCSETHAHRQLVKADLREDFRA